MTWDLLFEAMHAAMMAREHVRGTTLFDVAKATATAWHDPDAPAWSATWSWRDWPGASLKGTRQAAPVLARRRWPGCAAAAELKETAYPSPF